MRIVVLDERHGVALASVCKCALPFLAGEYMLFCERISEAKELDRQRRELVSSSRKSPPLGLDSPVNDTTIGLYGPPMNGRGQWVTFQSRTCRNPHFYFIRSTRIPRRQEICWSSRDRSHPKTHPLVFQNRRQHNDVLVDDHLATGCR